MPDGLDAGVLGRFVGGDRDAFETLFRAHHGDVHRWILAIVRDRAAADDVAAEAFWRAYRGRARFDAARSFGAWMRTIATNAARDHLRAERRRAGWRVADDTLAGPAGADPGLRQAVALAFRRLPPKLHIAAVLALVEQRPYAEIAEALDVPVGTVKARVFRATRRLREELARLGVTPGAR